MGKIMIIAGEVSGDMHAAKVVKEINKLSPGVEIFGFGSTNLKNEGVNLILDPTEINSIGFLEALKNIKLHRKHLKLVKETINRKQPDVMFLVDYSGFNMLTARLAYKRGIPAVNYFPPTAWIWGKWRARWLARRDVTVAAVFPQERDIYVEAGADVKFVGHPLLDIVKTEESKEEIYSNLELSPQKKIIALLPGSRKSEINRHLPELLQAAEKLQAEDRNFRFILALPADFEIDFISNISSRYRVVLKIVRNYTYQVMKIADLIVTASGTAALEAAIMGTPMVIIYKTSESTYRLGKFLLNVDYIGLPNILVGREIVPELIQEEANGEMIYRRVKNLIYKPYLLQNTRRNLQRVKEMLGKEGAVTRTAKLVLEKGDIKCGE